MDTYTRRNTLQYLLMYVLIGAAVYGLIYYIIRSRTGISAPYNQPNILNNQGVIANPQSPTPLATATPEAVPTQTTQSLRVQFTDSGFSPSSLQVKLGDTVTWVNDSSSPVWVASDPHPQHTNLPGFDAKRSIASGDSYSYTFNEVGSWGYHNHLSPGNSGAVIVSR